VAPDSGFDGFSKREPVATPLQNALKNPAKKLKKLPVV
jgi:hypothetical protein